MSIAMNPAAPHFLPGFITAPGETDPLLVGAAIFLIVLVLILGSTYFWLHSIPERIAHGTNKIQFQLVAVMSLLALFTHNTAFWIGALLLALIPIPDFWTPLANMADSLAKMAGRRLRDAPVDELPVTGPEDAATVPSSPHAAEASPISRDHAEIGTAPVSGDERAALAAKAGSDQRRALSKEGA